MIEFDIEFWARGNSIAKSGFIFSASPYVDFFESRKYYTIIFA